MYVQGSGQFKSHLANCGHPSIHGFKDVIHAWKAHIEEIQGIGQRGGDGEVGGEEGERENEANSDVGAGAWLKNENPALQSKERGAVTRRQGVGAISHCWPSPAQ
jgi:hypothetical protein